MPAGTSIDAAVKTTTARLWAAGGLGLLALGTAGILAVKVWATLPKIPVLEDVKGATSPVVERYLWVSTGSHLVFTIASFLFLYQVLRIAERQAIPLWLRGLTARDLLGIDTPIGTALKVVREVAKASSGAKSGDDDGS